MVLIYVNLIILSCGKELVNNVLSVKHTPNPSQEGNHKISPFHYFTIHNFTHHSTLNTHNSPNFLLLYPLSFKLCPWPTGLVLLFPGSCLLFPSHISHLTSHISIPFPLSFFVKGGRLLFLIIFKILPTIISDKPQL